MYQAVGFTPCTLPKTRSCSVRRQMMMMMMTCLFVIVQSPAKFSELT